jgi:hypothetical protein
MLSGLSQRAYVSRSLLSGFELFMCRKGKWGEGARGEAGTGVLGLGGFSLFERDLKGRVERNLIMKQEVPRLYFP